MRPLASGPAALRGGAHLTFRHAGAFWAGVVASGAGVALHLPMFVSARHDHFRMAGMRPDAAMLAGMALIVVGLAVSTYGLLPRRRPAAEPANAARIAAARDARLTAPVIKLLLVLALAVVIDAMKVFTLAFVAPGMATEYGLSSAAHPHRGLTIALLPLVAITGTVTGSFLWGALGDRIGRRAAIILAGLLFMTTAICGAMPGYAWNLAMCFMMGVGAGGMLPITFTLVAESVPARHRGWLMVLIGGLATGSYGLTSWLASALIPHYSWRIMWLIGLPTGLALILLSRWLPESPRFLLAHGRDGEAAAIMGRFGMRLIRVPGSAPAATTGPRDRFGDLWARRLRGRSAAIALLGIGLGVVTYGFQMWIPSNLDKLGFTAAADRVLRDAALIAYPFTIVTAWLYGFWSSKKTILLLTGLTVAALAVFIASGDALAAHQAWLVVVMAVPVLASGSAAAALGAYSSEVYPTLLRVHGGGLSAGAARRAASSSAHWWRRPSPPRPSGPPRCLAPSRSPSRPSRSHWPAVRPADGNWKRSPPPARACRLGARLPLKVTPPLVPDKRARHWTGAVRVAVRSRDEGGRR